MLTDEVPLLYWWHFAHEEAFEVCLLANSLFSHFKTACPTFVGWLKNNFLLPIEIDVNEIFNRDYAADSDRNTLHVTACYYSPENSCDAVSYYERPAVQSGLNQPFKMNVIGFFITPRTFGARVRLTEDQLLLYNMDDNATGNSTDLREKIKKPLDVLPGNGPDPFLSFLDNLEEKMKKASGQFDTSISSGIVIEEAVQILISDKQENISISSVTRVEASLPVGCEEKDFPVPVEPLVLKKVAIKPQDTEILGNFKPIEGTGQRAHITLGCAEGVQPVVTGFDLVRLTKCEQSVNSDKFPTFELDIGWLRCYDEAGWMFYPKDQYVIPATFQAKTL